MRFKAFRLTTLRTWLDNDFNTKLIRNEKGKTVGFVTEKGKTVGFVTF